MKKFLLILLFLFINNIALAGSYTLKAGVSVEEIPDALFGSWRVSARLIESSDYKTFKPQSLDMWNLSRIGDKVTLSNPFTGANAEVSVATVEGNLIVFSKRAPYDNKMLTDTITIRLDKNTFEGINTLILETFSNVDKHLINTENARYKIVGEKMSGDNILDKK